jgi:hypothetical protein
MGEQKARPTGRTGQFKKRFNSKRNNQSDDF